MRFCFCFASITKDQFRCINIILHMNTNHNWHQGLLALVPTFHVLQIAQWPGVWWRGRGWRLWGGCWGARGCRCHSDQALCLFRRLLLSWQQNLRVLQEIDVLSKIMSLVAYGKFYKEYLTLRYNIKIFNLFSFYWFQNTLSKSVGQIK